VSTELYDYFQEDHCDVLSSSIYVCNDEAIAWWVA